MAFKKLLKVTSMKKERTDLTRNILVVSCRPLSSTRLPHYPYTCDGYLVWRSHDLQFFFTCTFSRSARDPETLPSTSGVGLGARALSRSHQYPPIDRAM
ncbi:hypothetical protein RRG08_019170 [Elysia crispata]|uniref:Uncharacterized protein n=1 Tax=Elysia crispata TaxID=231223 RepID=A0AAE0YDR8_9GAST|nr:hypothetical protein RRG08_019170 [Elysia crispata]